MGNQPVVAIPTGELVTKDAIGRTSGVNVAAFTGDVNPSTTYRRLVMKGTDAYPIFRELEEKDSTISSSLQTRRALVLARSAQVISADENSDEANRIAEETARFLDDIPAKTFRNGLWELLHAPGMGYSAVEIFWDIIGSDVRVVDLRGIPQEWIRFGTDNRVQTGDPLLTVGGGLSQLFPIPKEKLLLNIFQPKNGDQRGTPLLLRMFWNSHFKRRAEVLDLRFLEKSEGTVTVEYGDVGEKERALAAAELVMEESAVAIPKGFPVNVLEAVRSRDGNDYKALIDYLDAENTRIMLSQTLTSRGQEGGKGTQALGNVHLEILWQIVKADAQDLEDVVNDQLLSPWLKWTFGDKGVDRDFRPTWTIDKEPPSDLAAVALLLRDARALGLEIPSAFAREKLGIPVPEEGEETLSSPTVPGEIVSANVEIPGEETEAEE